MSKKNNVTKNMVPEGFTLGLALFDGIPVIAFGITLLSLCALTKSYLILLGSLLVFFAGASKVIWKLIVVIKKKNIWFLFVQMRYLMPPGMIILLTGLNIYVRRINAHVLFYALTSNPVSLTLILIGIFGMVLMAVFAFTLDGSKPKNNWIEQITNAIAQIALSAGVVLTVIGYWSANLM